MPKIELSVDHKLGQSEAKQRISKLLADTQTKFAGRVSNMQESWNNYVDTFSFDAMGFSVSGHLDVQPATVSVTLSLPLAAWPFKSRIESEMRTHAQQLLA